MNRNASRIGVPPGATRGGTYSRDTSMKNREQRMATNEKALIENSQPVPDAADEHRRDRRPEDPRTRHDRGVQRHGVADLVGFHQLGHEPSAGRVVERAHDAEHEREPVDDRQVDHSGQIADSDRHRLSGQTTLGHDRHLAAIDLICHRSRPGPEHQHRCELERRQHPEGSRSTREPCHQDRHRGELHPRADVRQQQTGEEQPRIPVP